MYLELIVTVIKFPRNFLFPGAWYKPKYFGRCYTTNVPGILSHAIAQRQLTRYKRKLTHIELGRALQLLFLADDDTSYFILTKYGIENKL